MHACQQCPKCHSQDTPSVHPTSANLPTLYLLVQSQSDFSLLDDLTKNTSIQNPRFVLVFWPQLENDCEIPKKPFAQSACEFFGWGEVGHYAKSFTLVIRKVFHVGNENKNSNMPVAGKSYFLLFVKKGCYLQKHLRKEFLIIMRHVKMYSLQT